MNTTDITDTGILAAKRGQLDKARNKAEAAAAEAQRLEAELLATERKFFGLVQNAKVANDDLHETQTAAQRMRNLLPATPPTGCNIVEFLAELPPQRLGEMAGQHIHSTLPGIRLLEQVADVHKAAFDTAADEVERYAREVGIHASLVADFKAWRKLPPEARANPTRNPSFL